MGPPRNPLRNERKSSSEILTITQIMGASTSPISTQIVDTRRRRRLSDGAAVCALVVIGALLRAAYLGRFSFYGDEVFTLRIACLPFAEAWKALATDVHPPLHSLLIWGWVHVAGCSEFAARIPGTAAGAAVILLAWLVGREVCGRRAGLAVAYLCATSPLLVLFSRTVRWYMPLAAISLLSLWLFARLMRGDAGWGWWAAHGLACIAGLYYDLTFIPVFLVQWIGFAVSGRRWAGRWYITQAVALVAFVPWVAANRSSLLSGTGGFDRAPVFGGGLVKAAMLLFDAEIGPTILPWHWQVVLPYTLVFGTAVTGALLALRRMPSQRERLQAWQASLLLGIPLLPPLMMLPLPRLSLPSYFIPSAVGYLLLKSFVFTGAPRRWTLLWMLAAATCVNVAGLANLYAGREYQRAEFVDDWRYVAGAVAGMGGPDDIIIGTHPSFAWYLERNGKQARAAAEVTDKDLRRASRVFCEFSPLSGYSENNERAARETEARLIAAGFEKENVFGFNPDPYAGTKRRFVHRQFPPYRTTVTVYRRSKAFRAAGVWGMQSPRT